MKNIILMVCLMTFSTTYSQESIKDNGIITTQERSVTAYNEVANVSSLDVILTEGEEGKIRVEASENILPYILAEVKNQQLTVTLKPNYSYHFKHRVKVYVPVNENLKKITMSGSGDIQQNNPLKVTTLDCYLTGSGDINLNLIAQNVYLNLQGSGDIKALGNTNSLKVEVKGSGDVEAEKLIAQSAEVSLMGSGDVSVYAKDEIKASLIGSGDIAIYGNPKNKETKVMGSGDIKFR